ncbi:MAG TPA: hypothetical protein PLE54_09310 [Burkholderiaceae bacterium]|jgi:hypothetical protein|nr:hypothetical protein [Burkholderiaceae bacterium]HQR70790.1 hypothetical protein [Burkholderiaceae bacterium]
MNDGRLEHKATRMRRTLAVGLVVGAAAMAAAILGAAPRPGEDAERDPVHAEDVAQMHLVLGNRSVGELFPVR